MCVCIRIYSIYRYVISIHIVLSSVQFEITSQANKPTMVQIILKVYRKVRKNHKPILSIMSLNQQKIVLGQLDFNSSRG